jgi:hypothetical protein
MLVRFGRGLATAALCATLVFGVVGDAAASRRGTTINGNFNTSIVVANPGDDEALVTLEFRTADGNPALAVPPTFTVKPGSSVLTYVPNIPNLADGRYGLIVQSSRYVSVIANLAAVDGTVASAYNGVSDTNGDYFNVLYAPYTVANSDGYTSSIVVQNGQGTAANVTINYRDINANVVATESRTIAGYASSLFDQTGTPNIGDGLRSAEIRSDRFVSAMVMVQHQAAGRLGSYHAMRGADPSIYMPVVYNQYAGYVTALIYQNADPLANTTTSTFYDATTGRNVGSATSPAPIPYGVSQTILTSDAPGFTAPVPTGFNGSAVARSAEARTLVGIGVVRQTLLGNTNFELYNSVGSSTASNRVTCASLLKNYYGYNTSVTVQNVGTAPTGLTLQYADGNGRTVLAQTLQNVQPGASWFNYTPSNSDLPEGFSGSLTVQSSGQKIVAVVNELLGNGDRPGDQLLTYSCDNSLAGAASSYRAFAPVVLKNSPLR